MQASFPFPEQITPHHVYILISLIHPNRIYIGETSDIEDRLKQHNAGDSPYTARHAPWKLATVLTFSSKEKAKIFEAYCKEGSGFRFVQNHLLG